MKRTCRFTLMFAVIVVLATSLGLAKSADESTSKSANIIITAATATPDAELKPGTYRMTLLNAATAPEVEFYQGRKLVCKCPVKIETLPRKSRATEMFVETGSTGTRVLKTISIGGWTEKVIFSEASGPGAGR
ncbi:MAG TPA: hypothetical protein VGZ29_14635 [Terriglobia bacterium]|nr:hypothetical protein [Terriglobia bacterium]